MTDKNNSDAVANFKNGLRDGIPVALGYFAVAFSLGFVAAKANMSVIAGMLSSFLNHASAGEYAEITAIINKSSYIGLVLVILITNARYLLMSFALSQKCGPDITFFDRILLGFGITDEMFALTVSRKGSLNAVYAYGVMAISIPSWSLGMGLGIFAGNVLPAVVVNALGVAIYGMFIAIIIPPAKKEKRLLGVIAVSFALSLIFSLIPYFKTVPESIKVVALTIIIGSVAALLFPVSEEESKL